MNFSGYETIDSILKLKNRDEVDKTFLFVKMMADIVDEKDAIFEMFSKSPDKVMQQKLVRCGDLCFFSKIDCGKCLVGRVIQFLYLARTLVFSQSGFKELNSNGNLVTFKPIENVFTPGYLPMKHYVLLLGALMTHQCKKFPSFPFLFL